MNRNAGRHLSKMYPLTLLLQCAHRYSRATHQVYTRFLTIFQEALKNQQFRWHLLLDLSVYQSYELKIGKQCYLRILIYNIHKCYVWRQLATVLNQQSKRLGNFSTKISRSSNLQSVSVLSCWKMMLHCKSSVWSMSEWAVTLKMRKRPIIRSCNKPHHTSILGLSVLAPFRRGSIRIF